jgi:hypothetical protein
MRTLCLTTSSLDESANLEQVVSNDLNYFWVEAKHVSLNTLPAVIITPYIHYTLFITKCQ